MGAQQVGGLRRRRRDAAPGDPLAGLAAVVDLVAVHLQRLVERAPEIASRALRQPFDLEAEPVVALLLPEDDHEVAVQALPALVAVAERQSGRQVGRIAERRLDAVQRERGHLRARRRLRRRGEQTDAEKGRTANDETRARTAKARPGTA